MKYNNNINITSDSIDIKDLEKLVLMAGYDRDDLDSLREDYVGKERDYRDELTENIAFAARELGYDGEPYYNNLYWFFRGSQKKEDDDKFFNDLRLHPIIQHDPLSKLMRESMIKKFHSQLNKERIQREDNKFFKELRLHPFIQHDPLSKLMRESMINRFQK